MWLKKGECLHSLGRLDEAAFAYAQVVNLAPNHLDARLILASLHQQLGRPNQALDILSGEKSNIFYYVSDLTWIRNQIFAMTGRNAVSRGTYMYQGTQL